MLDNVKYKVGVKTLVKISKDEKKQKTAISIWDCDISKKEDIGKTRNISSIYRYFIELINAVNNNSHAIDGVKFLFLFFFCWIIVVKNQQPDIYLYRETIFQTIIQILNLVNYRQHVMCTREVLAVCVCARIARITKSDNEF